MLHWRHHTQASLTGSGTPVPLKVNGPVHLHSSVCTQWRHLSKNPPISVQSRQVHLVTSVDSFSWSEPHSTCPSCSKQQSVGPPDCCLLQFDHVGCGWLHADELALVTPQMLSHPHAIGPTLRRLVVASGNQFGGRWLVLATTRQRWVCLTACRWFNICGLGGPVSTVRRWMGSWTDGFAVFMQRDVSAPVHSPWVALECRSLSDWLGCSAFSATCLAGTQTRGIPLAPIQVWWADAQGLVQLHDWALLDGGHQQLFTQLGTLEGTGVACPENVLGKDGACLG